MIFDWLKRLGQRLGHRPDRKSRCPWRAATPLIEQLEDRLVPSGTGPADLLWTRQFGPPPYSPGDASLKTVSVDGYLVLAGPEFNQEFASISPDPSRFLAWARQPLTKDRLNTLSNAKDNWRLELRSGTLELTDFACRKGEFTAPEFPKRIEALADLASSLEAATGELGGHATRGPESER